MISIYVYGYKSAIKLKSQGYGIILYHTYVKKFWWFRVRDLHFVYYHDNGTLVLKIFFDIGYHGT